MKTVLKYVSFVGLALSIVPAFFVFSGHLSLEKYYTLTTIGMFVWFGGAVFWIKHEKTQD